MRAACAVILITALLATSALAGVAMTVCRPGKPAGTQPGAIVATIGTAVLAAGRAAGHPAGATVRRRRRHHRQHPPGQCHRPGGYRGRDPEHHKIRPARPAGNPSPGRGLNTGNLQGPALGHRRPHTAHHDPGFIETMQLLLVNGGLRLVAAIAILVVGWTLASYVKSWLEAGLKHLPLDLTLKPLIASLARYAVLIITLILVMEQFGVQTTSLIAVIGAAGLAIGLAMQGTLSNVAAGVMLLILRPFRVGHYRPGGRPVGHGAGDRAFHHHPGDRDMIYMSVPNSTIFGGIIINYTRERLRRVTFAVPVDYFNDLRQVEKIILEAIAAEQAGDERPGAQRRGIRLAGICRGDDGPCLCPHAPITGRRCMRCRKRSRRRSAAKACWWR